MPGKIVLIAALLTLAFWLGSLGGCASHPQENNYKLLQEDKPILQHSTDPSKPGESMAQPASAALATAPTTEPEAAPSLHGIDRSGWEHITVTPADGTTKHYRVYFYNCPIGFFHRDPDADPVANVLAVKPNAANWDGVNALSQLVQPMKYMFDFLTLPGAMVIHPPWQAEYTPPLGPAPPPAGATKSQ